MKKLLKEGAKARPTKGKRRASVKGGFYFVPGLENHVTNYRRIRWKVKQAPWCLLERYTRRIRRNERKREREKERERPAERNVITSCSTMNEDAIYFACLMSSSGDHSCEVGILRQPLREGGETREGKLRNGASIR